MSDQGSVSSDSLENLADALEAAAEQSNHQDPKLDNITDQDLLSDDFVLTFYHNCITLDEDQV